MKSRSSAWMKFLPLNNHRCTHMASPFAPCSSLLVENFLYQGVDGSSSCAFCTMKRYTRSQNCSTRTLSFRNLCAPAANDIVRIHISSERICAKSFRCLQVCMANRSTLVLCKYANIIVYLLADVSFRLCLHVAWERSRDLRL